MNNKRREFLKLAGLTGISVAGGGMLSAFPAHQKLKQDPLMEQPLQSNDITADAADLSIIGLYGKWATSLNKGKLPSLSFRRNEWKDIASWKKVAVQRLRDRLAIPVIDGMPPITVNKQYVYDGLQIEEITWQLPYGRPTEAIILKPENAKGKLPAILAFHDHGGNKYFGTRKITRTPEQHPLMKEHQQEYYSGVAWANEIAKRGYVVMVSDAFTFASRRVLFADVPDVLRNGHNDEDPESPESIKAYNEWAGQHEHVMAKSLFSAGTTWPGVFFAEDNKALDILCARPDVDQKRIGCGGLSGGGIRTVFSAGLDPRIKCAVDVGFMTTWNDFVLNKSFTHTWMTYVPLLPNELDFPEILGLRVPLPTLVLDDREDDLYTLPEMQHAEKILTDIFAKAGAADKFKCSYYPGPHKFDSKMQAEAFDWFDRWLKS